jgi:hypothetical protein
MRVTNNGNVPVRLAADARLLWLEVTPRSARKAVRCTLPADMRPSDDMQSPLVLPPKRSYAETIEPRLYCFGRAELDALAPGAIVVAHLGWPGTSKSRPFVVSPIDGVEPSVAPLRSIAADAIAVPDEPTAAPAPTEPPAAGAEAFPPRLTVTSQTAVDASSPNDLSVPVTLHNDGTRPVLVRFRPGSLAFEVNGPGGIENCAWPLPPAAPMRELFTTLAPRASATLSVLLNTYCTGHALDQSGLIVVRPRLDTRRASGAEIGLRTFDGEVIALHPTVVRLHRGATAKRQPALRQPQLEPAAAPPAPAPAGAASAPQAP